MSEYRCVPYEWIQMCAPCSFSVTLFHSSQKLSRVLTVIIADAEWRSCKQLIQNSQFKKHSEVINYLSTDQVMCQMYPNLCALAQICRVIPIHSADVERTLSQLKIIKIYNIRNQMLETLDIKFGMYVHIMLTALPV